MATADTAPQSIAPDGCATFTANMDLEIRCCGRCEAPNLYSAVVTVESGERPRDAERVSFGVRTATFDADKGFFLNGKPVKIKGTCNHQDHAGVGAALPDRLQFYRVGSTERHGLQRRADVAQYADPGMGGSLRPAGHDDDVRNALDEFHTLKAMAQLEAHDQALPQLAVRSFSGRWATKSVTLQSTPQGPRIVADMVARTHELDPTRPCTAAVNGSFESHFSDALDVMGFNYNLKAPDSWHKAHPAKPCVGSETASTVSTRGIYSTDKLRNWVSAYDLNYPPWAESAEQWWKFYAAREWLAGGFAWTGFDYRGEPTPYGWPSINSQFGIVDMCGFPKDNFYYYKAWWGSEPVLHLFPHWNWEQRNGEPISVWVHSNLDSVEVFLNGKSQGSQNVQPLTHLEWKVKYEPGVLEARGIKNGKVVLVEKRETTGKPASIRLTADRNEINADGEDLAVLRVEVLDKDGRPVPTADTMTRFKVTGEGKLIGVGNGDPNCQESDKEPQRSLFNGLAQAIVQSSRTPGTITVEVSTNDWSPTPPAARVTITTKRVDLRPSDQSPVHVGLH